MSYRQTGSHRLQQGRGQRRTWSIPACDQQSRGSAIRPKNAYTLREKFVKEA